VNDFQSSGDELTVATRASGSGLTDEEKTETEEMGIKIGYLAGLPSGTRVISRSTNRLRRVVARGNYVLAILATGGSPLWISLPRASLVLCLDIGHLHIQRVL
jgi:hypothetical protein